MIKKITLLVITFLIINASFSQITEIGIASFYADKFDGRITASGAIFNQRKLTAAHRTLPFGSKVKVTNMVNKKSIVVVINDRGPFVKDRLIDLSKAGAKQLDFVNEGRVKVKLEVLSMPNDKNNEKVKSYKPKTPSQDGFKDKVLPPVNVAYYKINAEVLIPKGFGIQVASYQEVSNLIKKCDLIKKQTLKDVIVQVAEKDNNKVYRIIIGSFATRNDAVRYNEKTQNDFSGSFVVAF